MPRGRPYWQRKTNGVGKSIRDNCLANEYQLTCSAVSFLRLPQIPGHVTSTAIDYGFTPVFYSKTGFAAPNGGRIKVALTGGPSARPSVCDLNFSVGA